MYQTVTFCQDGNIQIQCREEGEEAIRASGRRLSGRVGEEVRRLEEGGGGGEHVLDQGVVVGGKRKHGEEDKECISLTGGGGGGEGEQKRKRKGGRVSNLMKLFK